MVQERGGFGVGLEYNRVPYNYGNIGECVGGAYEKPATITTQEPAKDECVPKSPKIPPKKQV